MLSPITSTHRSDLADPMDTINLDCSGEFQALSSSGHQYLMSFKIIAELNTQISPYLVSIYITTLSFYHSSTSFYAFLKSLQFSPCSLDTTSGKQHCSNINTFEPINISTILVVCVPFM